MEGLVAVFVALGSTDAVIGEADKALENYDPGRVLATASGLVHGPAGPWIGPA